LCKRDSQKKGGGWESHVEKFRGLVGKKNGREKGGRQPKTTVPEPCLPEGNSGTKKKVKVWG